MELYVPSYKPLFEMAIGRLVALAFVLFILSKFLPEVSRFDFQSADGF